MNHLRRYASLLIVVASLSLLMAVVARTWWRPADDASPKNADVSAPASSPSLTSPDTRSGFEAPAATTEPPPLITRSTTSPLSEPVRAELARVDPTADGSDSEAFSEQASSQLAQLAKTIAAIAAGDMPSLDPLLRQDFRCGPLRPESLAKAFEDGRLKVLRGKAKTADSPTDAYQRDDGLIRAINALIAPWMGAKDIHAHFKIIRVDLGDALATTKTHVQLAGRTPTGYVQQNAVWNCQWNRGNGQTAPSLKSVEVEDFEEIVSTGEMMFSDCTEAVLGANPSYQEQLVHGIDHWRDTLDWRLGLDVAGPHGLAVGDVNGDGLDDMFLCEPGGLPNRLYLQQPDGTARDASAESGVDWLEPATSALLLDADNDGDEDLLFTSARYLLSCENDGWGHFTLRSVLTMTGIARSITAADYNGDGHLDVYVCCYISRGVSLDDVGLGKPMPYHDANNGPANYLFASNGKWEFQDVTSSTGLDVNNRRFSYAAAWEDYDNDGDQDLYVANDFGRNNLYRNDGGRFRDVAAELGVEDVSTGMSVSWGDYNRDGLLDLYVGNMFSSAGNRVTYQESFQADANEATRNMFRRLARGNTLFEHTRNGTFRDVSLQAGVTLGRWAWGSLFMDLNNDGWEDLVVANGMITSAEDPGDL